MKKFAAASFGLAALLASAPAWAGITNDTSLADPPGLYFGSGNGGLNQHFTVDNESSAASGVQVEIGLSAIQRFVGNIGPSGSTYFVNTGPTSDPRGGAWWGVDLSVNLKNTLNLSQITTVFSLQDVAKNTSSSFDALAIPDNAEFGAGGVCQATVNPGPPTIITSCPNASNYAFQNSEALSFPLVALAFGDSGFDMNLDDTYIFSLEVLGANGARLGFDQITVVAGRGATVPEPLTLSLFGAGMAGAVAMRRRKSKA